MGIKFTRNDEIVSYFKNEDNIGSVKIGFEIVNDSEKNKWLDTVLSYTEFSDKIIEQYKNGVDFDNTTFYITINENRTSRFEVELCSNEELIYGDRKFDDVPDFFVNTISDPMNNVLSKLKMNDKVDLDRIIGLIQDKTKYLAEGIIKPEPIDLKFEPISKPVNSSNFNASQFDYCTEVKLSDHLMKKICECTSVGRKLEEYCAEHENMTVKNLIDKSSTMLYVNVREATYSVQCDFLVGVRTNLRQDYMEDIALEAGIKDFDEQVLGMLSCYYEKLLNHGDMIAPDTKYYIDFYEKMQQEKGAENNTKNSKPNYTRS